MFFSACGKKQKNIFVFEEKPPVKVSFFDLPSVRGVSAKKTERGARISWLPISPEDIQRLGLDFCGYQVYRLTQAGVIPKKPIHKRPLLQTSYDDNEDASVVTKGYLVRAVFGIDKQVFYTPASRIVGVKQECVACEK